ncbi:MAG: hypothetical protein MUE81_20765 [Thermoflexibacter sp.]|jgi:uncharacterized protein (TIGR02646 family)|nr:hypothetical protein [Thermoflexibacter sp.]
MIRLQFVPPPPELTNEVIASLTAIYKDSEKSVWKQSYIERDLLKISFSKCCYCECKLNEESKYLEVEHFYPKSLFPDLVVVWDNLLPSCKRCNGNKNNHNTQLEPIIHPIKDNPKDYLILKAYRFYPKNKSMIGKTTIEVIDLNDRERLVKKRFEIGDKLLEQLENLFNDLQDFENQQIDNLRKERRLKRQLRNLMNECLPQAEYSATTATVLLQSEAYLDIKQKFTNLQWWNLEFEQTESQMKAIAFDSV